MAAGKYTMTDHGEYAISGAALKTAVDAVNITGAQHVSGAQLHIISVANGQAFRLIEVEVE